MSTRTDPHLVPLVDEWALWRDLAIRSAGFPVGGLDVFGPGDESARLAHVASNPDFAEAVIWQNRAAYRTAVANIATDVASPGSKRRRREDVIAAYWQRYCSKNDTIGFFGPLAWGTIRDAGPAIAMRTGELIAASEVHFESWCVEALARSIDASLIVPLNPWSEVDLRAQLAESGNQAGLDSLDRLEAARAVVSRARGPADLLESLDRFDHTFAELVGTPAVQRQDSSGGGRTPLYLDCMRGLHLDLGPPLMAELAGSMPLLLEAGRWWTGRCFATFSSILARALDQGLGEGRFEPLFDHLCHALWELPQLLAADIASLQDRCATALAAGNVADISARAKVAFADHGTAWPMSAYQSADIQIAARNVDCIGKGDYLAVVGDFHSGNPLCQNMFVARFPDPDSLRAAFHSDIGSPLLAPILLRNPAVPMSSRMSLGIMGRDDFHLVGPRVAPLGIDFTSLRISDLQVRDGNIVDTSGTTRIPLAHLFFLPMYIAAGVHTFRPFEPSGPRITIGRTVLRRASWWVKASDRPADAASVRGWAAERGLPRRAFFLCDGEAKPTYVDFESPSLTRNLHRMMVQAGQRPGSSGVRFTEMLPAADDCWLEQSDSRYTSEMRMVFVDRSTRGRGSLAVRA